MKRIRYWLLAVLLMPTLALRALGQTAPAAYPEDQVIIRFEKPTSLAEAKTLLDPSLFTIEEALVPSLDIYSVKLSARASVTEAIADLKKNPFVRWAQADHILELRSTVPNDPQFATQWALSQISDVDIDAPEAWDINTGGTDRNGHEVVVAIVDNGALLTQPDLVSNIWVNPHEIPDNGVDDDGNGYIDDVNGWDAYDNDGSIPVPGTPYHGTHVSGIVGARGNNGQQVCGVNWQVKLMIVAASNSRTSIVARGYNYVLAQKTRWWQTGGLNGANVIVENTSFGVNYGDCESDSFPIWNDLYNAMGAQGILSSCATSNINIDVDVRGDVPTGCSSPFIVAVTSTNSQDRKTQSPAAAWGDLSIDLGAPGVTILSTINTGTGTLSGTSMASPHVTGAVALMFAAASAPFMTYYQQRPDSGALLLKSMLLANVDHLSGFDTLTVSGGRLNLYRAVQVIHTYLLPDTQFYDVNVVSPNGGEQWVVGSLANIGWTSQGFPGNVKIELNRAYPAGAWENLFESTPNDLAQQWLVAGGTTAHARIRISSVQYTSVKDTSDADFAILGPGPSLRHDALADVAVGGGSVTALAWQPNTVLPDGSVRIFYRPASGSLFDSFSLFPTGNPNEYSASLASFPAGTYEYYVQVQDPVGRTVTVPDGAPAAWYSFDVGTIGRVALAYDDSTAERYSWAPDSIAMDFLWAVRFTPVQTPFVLTGARFAAARTLPDTTHTPVRFRVYLADGIGGFPGTLLRDEITGSVGNRVGGLPAGTNWANVLIRAAAGAALVVDSGSFYLAVGNLPLGRFEAFGRDTTGPNRGRSVFYDPCRGYWYSEDDTVGKSNAFPGNRLIQVMGYSRIPPTVVHNPLDDSPPGTGTVTAWATSPVLELPVTGVFMVYRAVGSMFFDSLQLFPTGYADEYAASLAPFAAGSYEYCIRAINLDGLTSVGPSLAPDSLFRFDVRGIWGDEIGYDDGTGDRYTWYDGLNGHFEWAVRFGPFTVPYILCGARFAASRSLPDTMHSYVRLALYAADSTNGWPGTLLYQTVSGSIGNDVGGTPPGTNWATVCIADDSLRPLILMDSVFYLSVENAKAGHYEAFGRDSTGLNQHRSFFYDGCRERWSSEDDTALSANARPSNRMIRAIGFALLPPEIVVVPDGTDIVLHWNRTGAPVYRVYSAQVPGGPFDTLEGIATDTTFVDAGAVGAHSMLFYEVRSATE